MTEELRYDEQPRRSLIDPIMRSLIEHFSHLMIEAGDDLLENARLEDLGIHRLSILYRKDEPEDGVL